MPLAAEPLTPSRAPTSDVAPTNHRDNEWTLAEGSPYPLGVTYVQEVDAYNFALYSKHATRVELLLFSESDTQTPLRIIELPYLTNKTSRVWHCRVSGTDVRRARYYGYRVDGPWDLGEGQRFDASKVLLDPYARAVFFPPGFDRFASSRPGSNLGKGPLGVLLRELPDFDWTGDVSPRHAHDLIIYELHVRGFTRDASSKLAPGVRGTYAGVIEKIPYLKELGVTAVELMPVFQCDPQEGSTWGYMTLGFFAPHHAYGSAGDAEGLLDEFRSMVKALHAAGIEVILDVVYNHSSEGDVNGPTYGFRGLDNTTYYLLEKDRSRYRDDAGTGNVLHTANNAVRALVLDSLRYWVNEMHVDGFRFDLASIFTRNDDGSINLEDPPIISAIRHDPSMCHVRLIAEAWDPATYQLGRSFPGLTWFQWNGQFRDGVRSFVKSDAGMVGELMTRLYGSADLFPDGVEDAYHPYQSINFVTAHDGFTLYDLVAYNQKHNAANGQGGRDGADENRSWNCGVEGDDGAGPDVLALRKRQAKNLFALLMLGSGTPMFRAGDEFLHTQGGNNNPYNQDNATFWLQWSRLDEHADMFRFVRSMIAFRKAHPSLLRSRFWREDIRWFGVGKDVDFAPHSHSLAFFLRGARVEDANLYVMVNAYWEPLDFTLQVDGTFRRVVDTGLASPDDIVEPGSEPVLQGKTYRVNPRSVVVLIQQGAV